MPESFFSKEAYIRQSRGEGAFIFSYFVLFCFFTFVVLALVLLDVVGVACCCFVFA